MQKKNRHCRFWWSGRFICRTGTCLCSENLAKEVTRYSSYGPELAAARPIAAWSSLMRDRFAAG